MSNATNILDRWIAAAMRRLTAFVRVEMDAYRLYTVVPQLVAFIESLTNIYVRYNRTRLKGRLGAEDCKLALASLFDVLLTVCKVSAVESSLHSGARHADPRWCESATTRSSAVPADTRGTLVMPYHARGPGHSITDPLRSIPGSYNMHDLHIGDQCRLRRIPSFLPISG